MWQLLRGQLFGKEVALILCGEAHEDAIDVTRKDGYFLPKEGWIDISPRHAVASLLSLVPSGNRERKEPSFAVRVAKQKGNVSKQGARAWAYDYVDSDDAYDDLVNESTSRLFLVFVASGKQKVHAFLLAFEIMEDDDEDRDNAQGHDVDVINPTVAAVAHALISLVSQTLDAGHSAPGAVSSAEQERTEKKEEKVFEDEFEKVELAEWVDLDEEARLLNRRRLNEAHTTGSHQWSTKISECEYDALIEKRKADRQKQQNILTWDSWYETASASVHSGMSACFCTAELLEVVAELLELVAELLERSLVCTQVCHIC